MNYDDRLHGVYIYDDAVDCVTGGGGEMRVLYHENGRRKYKLSGNFNFSLQNAYARVVL